MLQRIELGLVARTSISGCTFGFVTHLAACIDLRYWVHVVGSPIQVVFKKNVPWDTVILVAFIKAITDSQIEGKHSITLSSAMKLNVWRFNNLITLSFPSDCIMF